MVLSHDTNCGGDVGATEALSTWRYGYISEVVIPALREHGVSSGQLDQMLALGQRGIAELIIAQRVALDHLQSVAN